MLNSDQIAPPKPNKFGNSRVIFQSGRYVASVISAGLVVQSHRTGTGRLLPSNHPQYLDYVEAIETALDVTEGNALCRALVS